MFQFYVHLPFVNCFTAETRLWNTKVKTWSILRLCLIPLSSISTTRAMSGSDLRQLFDSDSGSFLIWLFNNSIRMKLTHPSYCFLFSSSTCSLAAWSCLASVIALPSASLAWKICAGENYNFFKIRSTYLAHVGNEEGGLRRQLQLQRLGFWQLLFQLQHICLSVNSLCKYNFEVEKS